MILAEEMGFGAIQGENNQALFVAALPPARNIITIGSGEVSSAIGCALWCMNTDSCSYVLYASDTNGCTMKKLA